MSHTIEARKWVLGQTDYLDAEITLKDGEGEPLPIEDDMPVAFTFDRETFHTAEWIGDVGPTRTCQLLLTNAELPSPAPQTLDVYVRVNDSTATPYIPVGTLEIT